MYNLIAQIFELVTSGPLFEENNQSDNDLLLEMIQACGPAPAKVLEKTSMKELLNGYGSINVMSELIETQIHGGDHTRSHFLAGCILTFQTFLGQSIECSATF